MFDPTFPASHAELTSDNFRTQFNGLKTLIDAVPTSPIASVVVDSVSTLPEYEPAAATATFDGANLHFTFAFPRGPAGEVSNAALASALSTALLDTPHNCTGVNPLSLVASDPPTQAEFQALIDKVNELVTALRREP